MHWDYIQSKKSIINLFLENVVYMALVQPYLFYCVEIWGHAYASYTKKLSILQKRLVRIITFSRYDDHTLPLFKSLKIIPFGAQYEYKVATLVFKSLQNALPYPFVDYFTPYMSPRNADHLQPPFCSHKLCEFSVRVMGPRIWNRNKKELKCCKTIGNFKEITQN